MRGTDVTRPSANRTLDASRLEPRGKVRPGWSKAMPFGALAAAALFGACAPHVNEERAQVPSEVSTRVTERRSATITRGNVQSGVEATISATLDGNLVRVKLEQPMECRDVVRTPGASKEEASKWRSCGTSPAAGVPIELQSGILSMKEITDAQGSATFDLAAVQDGDVVADDGQVIVRVGEKSSQTVDIRSAPIYSTWASSLGSKNAAQERHAERSQAIFAAARKRQADIVAAITTWAGANLVASQSAAVVGKIRKCFNAYDKPMDCNYPGGIARSVDWYTTRISASLQNRSAVPLRCQAVDGGWEKKKFFAGEFKPGAKKSGAIDKEDLAPLRAQATFACSITATDLHRGVVQDDVADAFRLEKFDGVVVDVTDAKDVIVGIGERSYRWNGNDYEMLR